SGAVARVAPAAAIALLAACTPAPPNASAGPSPLGIASRDAVVRVGSFAVVRAVAESGNRAFVVGDGGLALYDRLSGRWLAPFALPLAERGQPAGRVLAATNLIGDALWVAGGGRAFVVNASLRATFTTPFIGAPRAMRVERGGANAYVLADQWWQIGTTGSARPVGANELPPREQLADAADIADPAVRRAIDDPLLTRDASLRAWPVLAAARGATSSDVWLGTAGGGVFHVDPDFHRSEQLPFGLQLGDVRALARTADGVVVAEGVAPWNVGALQSAVTEGSDDLARWRWYALADQVGEIRSIALRARTLCVAGPSGAGMIELPTSGASSLPAAMVHAEGAPSGVVVASRDGCVVGTMSGVTVLPWGVGGIRRSEQLSPVYALATSGDTVWAGTRDGLVTLVGGHVVGVTRPFPAGSEIVAVATVGQGLAVASPDQVAIVDGAATERLTIPLGAVGRVTALAADERGLWIGGSNGALAVSLPSHASAVVSLDHVDATQLTPPGGREVHAIVLAPGVAWVGTAAGLVRVRRGDDGLPR
ncbi:MAG: hypothetical protein HOQ09_14395, partial [Gemmatimonadaceae bacterium]|nr:hypothetical protein [Gemmatimonadaceae bacterium]